MQLHAEMESVQYVRGDATRDRGHQRAHTVGTDSDSIERRGARPDALLQVGWARVIKTSCSAYALYASGATNRANVWSVALSFPRRRGLFLMPVSPSRRVTTVQEGDLHLLSLLGDCESSQVEDERPQSMRCYRPVTKPMTESERPLPPTIRQGELNRGRERLSPSPPSEPGVRFSRDGLSSQLFPHRDWRANLWTSDIVNSPRSAKKAFGHCL